jgi:hypothetical protein
MGKIIHVQTVVTEEDLEALKQKAGETSTKEALTKAISHYLECEYTKVEDMWAKKLDRVIQHKKKRE